MPSSSSDTEKALGSLYLTLDSVVKRQSPKLAPAEWSSEELLDLALAYCFDMQRKLTHACAALERFAKHADRKLAKQLAREDERLNADHLTWRQRARLAEKYMRDAHGRYGPKHQRYLKRLGGR
jgi:hypothetical protein